MDGQRRRELRDSVRLAVHGERWFLLDLVLAVVGFVGWVAATGALVALGAREAGVSLAIGQGSTQSMGLLAAAVVGWIVLPAIAATWRVRDRVTNVSGNVEGQYRFDSPGTLLGPAVALVVVAWIATAAAPLKWPALALAFVAGAYLLVRVMAFSYRVFSFSYPFLVHLAALLTFLLYATAGVVQLASVVDAASMVGEAATVLDVPVDLYGTVAAGPLVVPTLLTAAAATPVVLAAVYLACQGLAAGYVRWAEPTIDRGALRAGQRNPFQPTAANGAGGRVRRASQTTTPDGPGGDDGPSVPVHIQTTRVYDPDGEVADATGIETGTTSRGGQQCRTCGATFSPGTEVRFCPNCGQRLDDG